jgi:hypothetical protein
MNMLRDLWTTVASDPVTLAAALMMAAALLALLLIATPTRGVASNAQNSTKRPAHARSLAAHGTPATEIARQTGLSRDALALLFGATATVEGRKARPVAARFSGIVSAKSGSVSPEHRV